MNDARFKFDNVAPKLDHVTWPCTPILGESLIGFFSRSADYNAIRRPTILLADSGLPRHMRAGGIARTGYPLDRLAQILAVDLEWMAARRHLIDESDPDCSAERYSINGVTIRAVHLEYWTRRIAPEALRVSGHHRELWHVSTIPVCTETWDMLIETCPSCGRKLDWKRTRGIAKCSGDACRFDILPFVGSKIDESFKEGIAICAGLLNSDPTIHEKVLSALPGELRNESRGDLFELAWLLGCLEDPDFDAAVRNPKVLDAKRRCEALSRGGRLLASWPSGFATALAHKFESDLDGQEMNRLIAGIKSIVGSRVFGRASKLLDEALAGSRAARFSTRVGLALGFMTAQAFSEALGLDAKLVRELRRRKIIPHIVVGDGGKTLALFSEATFEAVRKKTSDRLPMVDFARSIGISVDGVYDLIADGILQENDDPIVQCCWPNFYVKQASADDLVKRLNAMALTNPEPKGFSVSRALRSCPSPDKPWPAIIRAILDGSLRITRSVGEGLDIRNSYVEEDGLRLISSMKATVSVVPGRSKSEFISEPDAWERLACSGNSIREMMRRGDLASTGRIDGATFSRKVIDDLLGRLISVGEITARLDFAISAVAVHACLRKQGVASVGGFYPRARACSLFQLS